VSLSETELKEFLTLNNVDCRSLKLLWEIDSKRVYGLTVSRAEAIDRWHRLRQLINESKYYPVILGCEDEIEWHNEYIARSSVSINVIIDRASTLDAKKWFCGTAKQIYNCEYVNAEFDNREPIEIITDYRLGEWQNDVYPRNKFAIPCNNLNNSIQLGELITIALIPTQVCWHVPAYLKFGNWNDCPAPEIHSGLMRYWHDRYEAEVVSITNDVMEMHVSKPPLNRYDALSLATEHYLYCNDIVEQGTKNLSILAAKLLKSSVWYFWWNLLK
jgi:Domain of unknown function (DUF4253)